MRVFSLAESHSPSAMGRDVRPSDMFAKGCGKIVSPEKPSCDEDGLAKKAVLPCSFMFPDVLQVQLRR